MQRTDYQKGILLALAAALISGVSVFVNGMAVKLADPLAYTVLKNVGALLFLGAVVLALNEMKNLSKLTKKQLGLLIAIGIIGGSVPFALFFWGLKLGGAAISSFIFRSLFVFAGVFGYLVLKEKPEPKDMAAGFVILIGNALLVSGDAVFGLGQILVLAATVLWALEYTLSRKAMADISPKIVMLSRMLFGSLLLFGLLAANGSLGALLVSAEVLQWLGLTSLLLFGFILAWYSALNYLPILKAASVFALGGVITAVLEAVFLQKTPLPVEALGIFLVFAGSLWVAGALVSARKTLPGLVE